MTSEPVILPPERHRRRGARPDPREPRSRRRSPRRSTWCGRRTRPRPAATSAWPTSSGCCASRRATLVGGVIDTETDALAGPSASLSEVTRHLASYNLVAAPVVDDDGPAARRRDGRRRARPPAAARLARARLRPGGRSRRPADRSCRPWHALTAGAPGSISRRCRGARVLPTPDPEAFGRFSERIARFLGTGRFLVIQTVVIFVWVVWNVAVPKSLRFDAYPFQFLTLVLSLAGRLRRAADPARAEPAGRPRPGQPRPGPRPERAAHRRRRIPHPRGRVAAGRPGRRRHPRLPAHRAAGPARRVRRPERRRPDATAIARPPAQGQAQA